MGRAYLLVYTRERFVLVGSQALVSSTGCIPQGGGFFLIPGGKIDRYEDPKVAACREFSEETGFQLDDSDRDRVISVGNVNTWAYFFALEVDRERLLKFIDVAWGNGTAMPDSVQEKLPEAPAFTLVPLSALLEGPVIDGKPVLDGTERDEELEEVLSERFVTPCVAAIKRIWRNCLLDCATPRSDDALAPIYALPPVTTGCTGCKQYGTPPMCSAWCPQRTPKYFRRGIRRMWPHLMKFLNAAEEAGAKRVDGEPLLPVPTQICKPEHADPLACRDCSPIGCVSLSHDVEGMLEAFESGAVDASLQAWIRAQLSVDWFVLHARGLQSHLDGGQDGKRADPSRRAE